MGLPTRIRIAGALFGVQLLVALACGPCSGVLAAVVSPGRWGALPLHGRTDGVRWDAEPLLSAVRTPNARAGLATGSRQEPPVFTEPLIGLHERQYPVCNVPNSTFDATLLAWNTTILSLCHGTQRDLQARCQLENFLCCTEAVSYNGTGMTMRCDLGTGLCDVHDHIQARTLVGAWKAAGCAVEGNQGLADAFCQCLKSPADAADFAFPTPCVVLHPRSGLLDPVTGFSTVSTAPFGPYAVRNLTRPRPPSVTLPGEEPRLCVPVTPVNVSVCSDSGAARTRDLLRACLAEPGATEGAGRPGTCCVAPFETPGTGVWCEIGGDCVRHDPYSQVWVLNDWAAATGCLSPAGEVVPPDQMEPTHTCICAPGEPRPDGGCVVMEDALSTTDPCVVVNSAAGEMVGGIDRNTTFVPSLDVCAA